MRIGDEDLVSSSMSKCATVEIGAKSFRASNGSDLNSATLIAVPTASTNSV